MLVSINELPLHLRRKYVLMACLWLGENKPNCNEYLKPFQKECVELSTTGVRYKREGVERVKKVKTVVGVSDSIARPLLRNTSQFNGGFIFCIVVVIH